MSFEINLASFWEENRQCSHSYTTAKPRLALSLTIGEEVIKSVAGITEHDRFYNDFGFQQETRAKASLILERGIDLRAGPAINVGSVTYASLFGGEVIATAGSLSEGNLMENTRALMYAAENCCRFDRPSSPARDSDKPLGPRTA